MIPKLKNVKFENAVSYETFDPINYLVYCDPPYNRTINNNPSKYLNTFNSNIFWKTMRKWSKHNLVFVSEESAPKDFIEIWRKNVFRNPGNNSKGRKNKHTDKLFIHKSWYDKIQIYIDDSDSE
jgi:DNA adenine methylase